MINHYAETECLGMQVLHSIPHFLCRYRVANESIRVTDIFEPLHVLHSESCLDKVAQTSDELPQGSKTRAELLDVVPRNFHTHVVVASTEFVRDTFYPWHLPPRLRMSSADNRQACPANVHQRFPHLCHIFRQQYRNSWCTSPDRGRT